MWYDDCCTVGVIAVELIMKVEQNDNTYVKKLWLEFYSIERSLYEIFDDGHKHGIKVLDHVPGYEIAYKTRFNNRGKPVLYPPKNIKVMCYVPPQPMKEIKGMIDAMEEVYQRAVEAGGDEFTRMPHRHPHIVSGIELVRRSLYPAHASMKVKIDEPVILAKRNSNLLKDKDDTYVRNLHNHYVNSFKTLGIDAKVNTDEEHIEVDGAGILKFAVSKHVQLRISSGMQYKLRLKDDKGGKHRYPYGFMIFDTKPKIQYVSQKRTANKIEDIATLIPFHFLDKSIKFWNKGGNSQN